MYIRLLSTFALLTLAAGCIAGDLGEVFGSGGAREVIGKPAKVQAYRLVDDSFYQPTVKDYKTAAGPIDVSDELAQQTSKLLLDPDSYRFNAAKGCEPIYGVRLSFAKDDQVTDVFFCFDCDILSVYFQGKPVGGEDFDDIRPQLVKIVKQVFPDDEAIQGLKEKR